MANYHQEVAMLEPLESFDASAFVGSADVPQSVCDFVLALSLAYNDLRDIFFARLLLSEVQPSEPELSPKLGHYRGLVIAIMRIQVGRVHELLKLIAESGQEIAHSSFTKVIKQLTAPGRSAWSALVSAAQETSLEDKTKESPLVRALRFVRNKVAFHYDTKKLRAGFNQAFVDPTGQGVPLLSRGGSLQRSRFYFADAAVEAFIREKDTDAAVNDFLRAKGDFVDNINQVLYEIVVKFVTSRGFGWRRFTGPQPDSTAGAAPHG
jgi:hypothetical protein